MILRPDAVVLPGPRIETGLEVCIENGTIAEIRPWTTASRSERGALLSPAFVNAHSHLEYFDLMGSLQGLPYWEWILELTRRKTAREAETITEAASEAALLNTRSGITVIGETCDFPVSVQAMRSAGLVGRVFQEVITVRENQNPEEKLAFVKTKAAQQQTRGLPVHLTPHAAWTVHPHILIEIAKAHEPQSIHVSEHPIERDYFERATGPIADLAMRFDASFSPPGCSPLKYLDALGCLHEKTQIVHACDFDGEDIEVAAARQVTIAHCPRSNANLSCPPAPVAEMRRHGIKVGIGLDSAASSGPIDMFAEMRAALAASTSLQDPLTAEDVWEMATTEGAETLWLPRSWRIAVGANPDLILLNNTSSSLYDIIQQCHPSNVLRIIRLGKEASPTTRPPCEP